MATVRDTSRRDISLPVQDWVTKVTTVHKIGLQSRIVRVLLTAYAGVLGVVMLILILEGFRMWGFHLSEGVLQWLGAASVGAIAGLLTLTMRGVFGKSNG
jgi:hypothetical protein